MRVVGTFPQATHPPIRYPAALLTGAADPADAAFLAFLRGPQGQAILGRHGFLPPPPPP